MNKNILSKKYYINGPESVSRLEGEIDGIKKIIYIFGEVHVNNNECENYNDSIDIDKFLIEIFKYNQEHEKENIDVFIEMFKEDIDIYHDNDRRLYMIEKMRKLLSKNISINDRVNKNKDFDKIRFHYFDIRHIFYNKYNIKRNSIKIPDCIDCINNIIDKANYMMYNILNFLNSEKITTKKKINLENLNYKPFDKIIKKYNNNQCKGILSYLFLKYILILLNTPILLNDFIDYCKESIKKLYEDHSNLEYLEYKNYMATIFNDIYIRYDVIHDTIFNCIMYITDLYLLRRLLDKDYITKSIIYSGDAHVQHIKYILLKHFNFKITHINNIKSNKEYKLAKQIKDENDFFSKLENKNLNEFTHKIDMFSQWNKHILKQCINLFDFPDNFS
jgi:hypothetical protein